MAWIDELKRKFGLTQSPVSTYGGWNDYGDPGMGPSQDKIDFQKEFMQSMIGGIGKPPKETSVGQLSIGGGQKRFQVNPLQAAPQVSQYAPTPGFSLVRPLRKKHWYDYGGTA
jgi:hypothetical protein